MKTSLNREEKNRIINKLSIQLLTEPINILSKKADRLNNLIAISLFNLNFVKRRRQACLDYLTLKDKYGNWFDKSNLLSNYISITAIPKAVNYKCRISVIAAFDEVNNSIKEKINMITNDSVKIPTIIKTDFHLEVKTVGEKVSTEEGGEYKEIKSIITSNIENQKNLDLILSLINNKNKISVNDLAYIYNRWRKVTDEIVRYNSVNTLYQALPSLKSIIEEVTGVKLDSSILKKEKYNEEVNKIIECGININ